MSIPGASSRLPAHPSVRLLSTYISAQPRAGKQKIALRHRNSRPPWPRPVQANKKSASVSFTGIGFFANLLYSNRMPLGFFAVSFPGKSMTLSPVTLAQYYPGKIAIFDTKPPISEAVTLSPPRFFFVNRPVFPLRSQILNVTASNISLSVKCSNGTDPRNP